MGSSGKGSTTTTGSPSPYAQSDLNSIMSLARQDQSLPFQGTQLQTAPVNAQQYQGIGGINQYANYAQPGISQAANWINQAAQPISSSQINQYMSPYTQDVVNSTQAQFNNQNQQQLQNVRGNAISQGAFGGNREAIAEAETTNQQQLAQAPVIAGLENQGYQTGLNTALTEQQNLANSAYGLTNVATSGQNAGLTGANAQIGAGTLEQQTQQAGYGNLWNYQQAQAAYPWQQLAALSPVYTGVASLEGGTTVGTPPAPSLASQAVGAGTLATGLFGSTGAVPYMTPSSYRGGAIKGYDSGGGVEDYIPIPQVARGTGIPKPTPAPSSGSSNPMSGLGSLGKVAGGNGIMGGLSNAFSSGMSSFGEAFPEAGAAIADALPFLALRRGGQVHGYDEGGTVLPSPYSTQSNGISSMPYGGHSYIPQIQVPRGPGIPKASQPQQNNMQQQMQQIKSLTDGLMGKPSNGPAPIASGTTAPAPPTAELEDSEHDPDNAQWRGGGIHGYANGGPPENKEPDDPINTLWNYDNPVPSDGSSGILPPPDQHWTNDSPSSGVIGQKGDIITQPRSPYIDTISSNQYNPDDPPNPYLGDIAPILHDTDRFHDLPPARTIGPHNNQPINDDSGVNLPPSPRHTNGIDAYTQPEKTAKPSGLFSGIDLSKNSKLWPSLISAGLGMMASRSPYAAVGIGEGGQQGLNTYQKLDTQERSEKLKQSEIDQKARQLSQQADQFEKGHKLKLEEAKYREAQPVTIQTLTGPRSAKKMPDGTLQDIITGETYGNLPGNKPISGNQPSAASMESAIQEGKHGVDFLNAIPSPLRGTIEAVGNYDAPITVASQRSGMNQGQLLSMVRQFNPEYDMYSAVGHGKAINEFLAGGPSSPAAQITSYNTAMAHGGEAWDALQELKTVNPGILQEAQKAGVPFLSYAAAKLQNASIRGTPEGVALNKFVTASTLYGSEVAKLYTGSVGSQEERNTVRAPLDPNLSLPEVEAGFRTSVHMMGGKSDALQDRYHTAMDAPGVSKYGTKGEIRDFPVIHARAQAALDRMNKSPPAQSKPTPADRFRQLIDSGKSKTEAYDQMNKEGY